jgi:electron transfer flavoprotein beta subunit
LDILVCIKQVLDPEAPVSAFSIDRESKRATQRGAAPVMNPFDENALEAALRVKDTHGSKITVISIGHGLSKAILRKSLAVGADELILVEDETYRDIDSYVTAYVLVSVIRKIGKFDLILMGREAADWGAGIVGCGVAEILDIPCINIVRSLEVIDGKVRAERVLSDGHEVIEASLPALVTISNELGELRSANLRKMMEAQKMPVTTWDAKEVGLEAAEMRRTKLLDLYMPHKETRCEMVDGADAEESGVNLALRLREAGII